MPQIGYACFPLHVQTFRPTPRKNILKAILGNIASRSCGAGSPARKTIPPNMRLDQEAYVNKTGFVH